MEKQKTLSGDSVIGKWFNDHKVEYANVAERLEVTKHKVLTSDISTSGEMVWNSYLNAVISQQTPVDRHEAEYVYYLDTGEFSGIAMFANQKANWIGRTNKLHAYNVVRMLKAGNNMDARAYLANNFVGLSWTKASFTLAMLGFTEFMCIDTNVAQMHDIEVRSLTSEDIYRETCDKIISQYDLDLEPFVLQWVLFDFNRGEHSDHKVFFESLGTW